jgi:hypothetical protein
VGHILHSSVFGVQDVDSLFFMIGWDRYGFAKKRTETRYTEVMFLHSMGSPCHVVHSTAFGVQNTTRYADLVFLHPVGSTDLVVHSGASGE